MATRCVSVVQRIVGAELHIGRRDLQDEDIECFSRMDAFQDLFQILLLPDVDAAVLRAGTADRYVSAGRLRSIEVRKVGKREGYPVMATREFSSAALANSGAKKTWKPQSVRQHWTAHCEHLERAMRMVPA